MEVVTAGALLNFWFTEIFGELKCLKAYGKANRKILSYKIFV